MQITKQTSHNSSFQQLLYYRINGEQDYYTDVASRSGTKMVMKWLWYLKFFSKIRDDEFNNFLFWGSHLNLIRNAYRMSYVNCQGKSALLNFSLSWLKRNKISIFFKTVKCLFFHFNFLTCAQRTSQTRKYLFVLLYLFFFNFWKWLIATRLFGMATCC